jgi:molybdate transport system ATP-binding protein
MNAENAHASRVWKGVVLIYIDIFKQFNNFSLSLKFYSTKNRCVIFGHSGSGKSSLLKMISGFYSPDKGTIQLKDKVIFSSDKRINLPIQTRKIGYLPQEYTLFPNFNIKENIEYGLKKRKMKDVIGIENLAKKFDILNCLDKYPNQISGGQKQRAALARALIVKPSILLLDEPFSALDKPIREQLRELVADVADSFDIPVLFVTHDLEEAFVFAQEVVVIENGRVVEFGAKEKIFNTPSYIESAKLFNTMNIWEIEKFKENSVKLKNGLKLSFGFCKRDAKFCCIKPENVMILRDDIDISTKENRVYVIIKKINMRGSYVHILTKTENSIEISINIPVHILSKMLLYVGKQITVSLKSESIFFCKEAEQ